MAVILTSWVLVMLQCKPDVCQNQDLCTQFMQKSVSKHNSSCFGSKVSFWDGGGLLQGCQRLLRTSGPQALGPSRPCPAREGQLWNSLGGGPGEGHSQLKTQAQQWAENQIVLGSYKYHRTHATFRLASRLRQVSFSRWKL